MTDEARARLLLKEIGHHPEPNDGDVKWLAAAFAAVREEAERSVMAEWEAALGTYPAGPDVPPLMTLISMTHELIRKPSVTPSMDLIADIRAQLARSREDYEQEPDPDLIEDALDRLEQAEAALAEARKDNARLTTLGRRLAIALHADTHGGASASHEQLELLIEAQAAAWLAGGPR
jgi:hypothetical protein